MKNDSVLNLKKKKEENKNIKSEKKKIKKIFR